MVETMQEKVLGRSSHGQAIDGWVSLLLLFVVTVKDVRLGSTEHMSLAVQSITLQQSSSWIARSSAVSARNSVSRGR